MFKSLLLKFIAILIGIFSAIPSVAPIPSSTPIIVSQESPVIEQVEATPTPSPTPAPHIDIIEQLKAFQKEVEESTPRPSPTPEIIYMTQPPAPAQAVAPTPSPTPQAALARVTSVDFSHNVTYEEGLAGLMSVRTDHPATVIVNYVVDDGSIMADYASGSKDNDRLSAMVAQYALTHDVHTVESEMGISHSVLSISDVRGEHVWFSISARNATGQVTDYLRYGNVWDWNSNINITSN